MEIYIYIYMEIYIYIYMSVRECGTRQVDSLPRQETQHQMDGVLRGALDQLERAQSRKLEFLQSMKRQAPMPSPGPRCPRCPRCRGGHKVGPRWIAFFVGAFITTRTVGLMVVIRCYKYS